MPLKIQDNITACDATVGAGGRDWADSILSTLGANLDPTADVHIVRTCATADDSVALPAYDPKLIGKIKYIKNVGTANTTLMIFPAVAGGILRTGGAIANSLQVARYATATLICIDGVKWIQT